MTYTFGRGAVAGNMFGRRISLSTKIILLIVIPLVAQLLFFGALAYQVGELEKEREAESRAVDSLVLVNLILNESMTAAGSFLMYRTNHEPFFLLEAQSSSESVDQHLEQLRKMKAPSAESGKAIKMFIDVIDEMENTFDSTVQMMESNAGDFASVQVMGTLKSFLKRIKTLGDKTVQLQMTVRSQSLASQSETRGKIQMLLACATIFNAGAALALAFVFSLTLGRRIGGLMHNAVNISVGRPLNPTLKGKDELAQLDRVIHDLSADLAITRQKERALIDNTAEIICAIDENLRITEVSPAVSRRLGYLEEEVRGVLLLNFVHEEDKDMVYKNLETLKKTANELEFEARLKSRDSGFRFMEIVGRWSRKDQSAFLILRDITLRKEAERLKQEVLAMVSHDMRAPLSSVSITLDMLCQGALGAMNDRGQRLVRLSQNSVGSLIGMINDLLDVERSESMGMNLDLERIEADELIKQAVETLSPEAGEKNVRLVQNAAAVTFDGDGARMSRVLVNLIGNAIKFTPQGGTVTVGCEEITREGRKFVEFKVSDTGPGIPEDKRASIFDKYSQVGTRSEGERRGSGLGLAICKTIVQAHGGSIGVESKIGSGSTFHFTIPQKA